MVLLKCLENWVCDHMCNFVLYLWMCLKRLQNELHEFASRCIDCLWFLIQLLIYWLHSLTHYELEGYVHDDLKIVILASFVGLLCQHPIKHFIEINLDVVGALIIDHVHYHLVLGVQYDVPQLPKVFNHNVRVILIVEKYLPTECHKNLGVQEELFNQRVEDPVVVLLWFWEPTFARETQSWVILFKEVQYVVKSTITTVSRVFFKEGTIAWIVLWSEIPEYREFFYPSFFYNPIFILQIIDDDLWKNSWQQAIKLSHQCDYFLMILLLVQK